MSTCLLLNFLVKSDAFSRRANRCCLSDNDNVARDLFSEVQCHEHCLIIVLADEKNSSQALRPRGHQF